MNSICAACGNSVAAGERFCRVCGREAAPPQVASAVNAVPAYSAPAETSGKAIVSLVCGIFSILPPVAIVAIVFGHLSLSDIKKGAGRLKGQGLAIAGLVLGYVGIVSIPIILIIAAIAIPNLLRARMAANESSAAAWVRTLNTAETAHAETHPNAGYTCTLSDLAEDQLITRELAGGRKSGYVFELSGCAPAVEGGPNTKFQVVAYPVKVNNTGTRAFCSDESMIVKVDASGSAQECLANGANL